MFLMDRDGTTTRDDVTAVTKDVSFQRLFIPFAAPSRLKV